MKTDKEIDKLAKRPCKSRSCYRGVNCLSALINHQIPMLGQAYSTAARKATASYYCIAFVAVPSSKYPHAG